MGAALRRHGCSASRVLLGPGAARRLAPLAAVAVNGLEGYHNAQAWLTLSLYRCGRKSQKTSLVPYYR